MPILIKKSECQGIERVFDVFEWIIQNAAMNLSTRTYQDIDGDIFGGNGQGCLRHLGVVSDICKAHGFPRANELIVNKAPTGKPRRCGSYVTEVQGVTEDEWRENVLSCYLFDWSQLAFEK